MYLLFLIYSFLATYVSCATILGVFLVPSYSHQIVYQPVWRELALRGHNLVVITPDPIRESNMSNLQQIDISFGYNIVRQRGTVANFKKILPTPKEVLTLDFVALHNISERMVALPEVQKLVKSNKKFDLVIMEMYHPGGYGLATKFNCPIIGMNSFDLMHPVLQDMGNPVYPSIYPMYVLPFTSNLSFWERLTSWKFSLWLRYYMFNTVYPRIDEMNRKYLGDNVPSVPEILKNISLVFTNINPLFISPKPTIPKIIEFTGLHIQPSKPLEESIQKFLNNAPHGVIYVSLGTNIVSNMLNPQIKTTIFEALSELPYHVLFKFEEEIPGNASKIKTVRWISQQNLLKNKNVRAFVTQGGIQSVEEAVRSRVPIVGLPFYYDQPRNIKKMVQHGIGRYVNVETMTKEELKTAIIDVAENEMYRKNIDKLANIFEDVPMTPLEQAVWWVEYVIRHKGAPHLQTPLSDLPWYIYLDVDILGYLLLCAICVICVIFYLFKVSLYRLKRFKKYKAE